MERKPFKKVWHPGSQLNLPLISFSYEDDRKLIELRVVDPSSIKWGEGSVTGFKITYSAAYEVEDVDRKDFHRWVGGKFKRVLKPAIEEIFRHDIDMRNWFPEMRSYQISTTTHSISGYNKEDLQVSVSLTVRFSEGIPYREFVGRFLDFISVIFEEDGHWEDVDGTVEALISERFPEATVSTHLLDSPKHTFFMDEGESGFNPTFIDITISLSNPLDKTVVESLLDSSNERDFVLKFAMLIDPSDVSMVTASQPGQNRFGRRISSLEEVKKLLTEVAVLCGA